MIFMLKSISRRHPVLTIHSVTKVFMKLVLIFRKELVMEGPYVTRILLVGW